MVTAKMSEHSANVNSFLSFAQSKGYQLSSVSADGKIHRFEHGKRKNGWYIAFTSFSRRLNRHFVCGQIGDWVSGNQYEFRENLPDADRETIAEIKAKTEQMKREREAEIAAKREEAAQYAQALWDKAVQLPEHPYTTRKQIHPIGARVSDDGTLLVPTTYGGNLCGLQRISADGTKKFVAGQKFGGTYALIGDATDARQYLCEGYATGVSIHLATGCQVIVAFSAGNLKAVAQSFQGYPIIVCADNDAWTDGNPGVKAAEAAAKILGTRVVIPQFKDTGSRPTDFNDLHQLETLEEVGRQLMGDENVVNLRDKRKKSKPDFVAELGYMADILQGKNFDFPPFPRKFHLLEREEGKRAICEEGENGIITITGKESVITAVTPYTRGVPTHFKWGPKQIEEAVKYWRNIAATIPEPAPFLELSVPGLCFERLPFDFDGDHQPTPIFDEFLNRCTNREAIEIWIGSLFVPESDRQQYLWIFGEGGDGKGSLARVLTRLLSSSTVSRIVPSTESQKQFFCYGLQGKRLCIFPECNNFSFPNDALFKLLTGNDSVPFEAKGEMSYSGQLQTKFMFLSNERPKIKGSKANLRRLIYSEVSPAKILHTSTAYDALLWSEAPSFIKRCVQKYRENCPRHEFILAGDELTSDLIAENEEELAVLADKWFVQDPNGRVTSARMQEIRSAEKLHNLEYRNLCSYLRRHWNSRLSKADSGRTRVWQGHRERTDSERMAWDLDRLGTRK